MKQETIISAFSPGAWRRSEAGVVRSTAERAPDRTPESGSRSAAVGVTAIKIGEEENVEKH